MVNAILLRIHQSGHLAEISEDRMSYIKEGILYHKKICNALKEGVPFWPLGLASFSHEFICVGVDCGNKLYLAAWRIRGKAEFISIPVRQAQGKSVKAGCSYPENLPTSFKWDSVEGSLQVKLEPETARIFEIEL